MIKYLLEKYIPSEEGVKSDDINLSVEEKTGRFFLNDQRACKDCKSSRTDRVDCDEKTLIVDADKDVVSIVNFEDYIEQLQKHKVKIGEKCDLLLFDNSIAHRKIAFCDLTCSEEKWVLPNSGKYSSGKKAKALSQMKHSVSFLLNYREVDFSILTFIEKVCIFGWRDYGNPSVNVLPERGKFDRNIQSFITTPSSASRELKSDIQILEHNFMFVQIKYPDVYKW